MHIDWLTIKWASVTLSRYASSGASQVDRTSSQGPELPPPPPVPEDFDEDIDPW